MYITFNGVILFILVAGFIYVFFQLKKLLSQTKELQSHIDDYIEFEHKITLFGSDSKNLTKYLNLRDKHKLEKITLMLMGREGEDVDKDALDKRQKQEIDILVSSRKNPSHDISFPVK